MSTQEDDDFNFSDSGSHNTSKTQKPWRERDERKSKLLQDLKLSSEIFTIRMQQIYELLKSKNKSLYSAVWQFAREKGIPDTDLWVKGLI